MKYISALIILIFLFGISLPLFARDWYFHGRVSNSIYAFESTGSTQTRIYQSVRTSLRNQKWHNLEFNSSFRILSDLNQQLHADERYQFYLFNLKCPDLFDNRLDLQMGRLFLHPGTILGGLDGLHSTLRLASNLSLEFYGGVESHFLRSAKIYKLEDALVAGGLFQWRNLGKNQLQIFYLQKDTKAATYWKLSGFNLESLVLPHLRGRVQCHYDLINSRFHRVSANVRSHLSEKLTLAANYKRQYPQIYANSFYRIFKISGYQQYQLSGAFNWNKRYFLNTTFQLLQVGAEHANQFILAVSNQNGNVGVIYESGYAGDQLGLMLDYAFELVPVLLVSASIDYSRYRTETEYEFDHQIGNALRLSYRFHSRWLLDIEYQWLRNRFTSSDSRILSHLHFKW